MADVYICGSDGIAEGTRRIVEAAGVEIAVYRQGGEYYAYRNLCTHQGGPACEGELIPRVEDVIDENKLFHGQRFNHDEMQIVCPWHSYEFSLKTGICAANPNLRLKKFDVIEREGGVYVRI